MPPPRSQTSDQRYYGVAVAIVTDNVDPESLGRVKVKFPWFDQSMDSEWCRVVNIYAGQGYGAFWTPEVGDEVLVAFEMGDMRRPYILGGLYNGVDKPSSARTDQQDQKLFRTKAGHQLLFDDSPGAQAVTLTTAAGHTLSLDDQQQVLTLLTTGGHKLTMDDAGMSVKLETSSGQSVTMDAASITIKASASVTVDAPSIKLGAAASQSLVLGQAMLIAFNSHTHNCTAPGTPSGPPLPPMTPAVLSTTNKTS